MSLLDLSRPWVHHGAPDLAPRAVSTLGDSSTSRLKHYRALQINHEGLCQERKNTTTTRISPFSWMESGEEGILQCCDEGVEKEKGVGWECGRIVEERERQKGDMKERKGGRKCRGVFEREELFSWCLYPAFLRHPDQLWWLSLVINSFRFN